MNPTPKRISIYPGSIHSSKILLVDDEKEFVQTLKERLSVRGLDAAIAYNGEDALSIVASDPPDIIVLDINMPGIDGLAVLRHVKQEYPQIEVIILTGHGSRAEKTLADELGVFSYLQKPVNIEVLTKTMKEAHSKTKESNNE